ncbi:MAG: hypothetical protein P1P87_04840 [Trueperaceae bacterium]|nr:hypothetical protein [Trueperaceae bacterium]
MNGPDLLPKGLLISSFGLFAAAVALYLAGQQLVALALLLAAIGDAGVALWWRGRQRR